MLLRYGIVKLEVKTQLFVLFPSIFIFIWVKTIYRSDVVNDTVNLSFNGRVFRVIGEGEHLGLTAR